MKSIASSPRKHQPPKNAPSGKNSQAVAVRQPPESEAACHGQSGPVQLIVPGRWFLPVKGRPREKLIADLCGLGKTFNTVALSARNLFLRMADHIRNYEIDPNEVRDSLALAGWSKPLVRQIKHVAYADIKDCLEYQGGVAFHVTLLKSRLHYMDYRKSDAFKRQKLRQGAKRLAELAKEFYCLDEWKHDSGGWEISLQKKAPSATEHQRFRAALLEPPLIRKETPETLQGWRRTIAENTERVMHPEKGSRSVYWSGKNLNGFARKELKLMEELDSAIAAHIRAPGKTQQTARKAARKERTL